MDSLESLEARLRALEETEGVKQAMFRYFRCLDDKLFEELGDCFTEDVSADYGMPGWSAQGRDPLVAFLSANESRGDYRVSHSSHNEEVKLITPDSAKGWFKLHDWVVMGGRTVMRGFGRYSMEFTKAGGTWRISVLKLHYAYREEHHAYVDNALTPPLTPALSDSD